MDKPSTRLFLFGAPRLERRQRRVVLDTRKALALLAYLALTRAAHSRDVLANLLWSDYSQSKARGALRRTLSVLNTALGAGQLEIERETIALANTAPLWIDVDEYRRLLAACEKHSHAPREVCAKCVGPLTQAAALYREDFLAGFSLRDSPNFEEWQFFQAEALRREHAGALERLARWHTQQKEYATAIEFARGWLALDPLHEPAHRALMEAYAATGQRAAALRQYRECVRELERELGVPPLAETTRLNEEIKAQRVFAPVPASSEIRAPLFQPAPAARSLFGRATEMELLARAYQNNQREAQFIVIEGEAGIGKTRLAEEFIAAARAQGARLIATRCYEGEAQLAFAPIAQGLRGALADAENAGALKKFAAPWRSEAERLLPELAGGDSSARLAPLNSAAAQSRFFESIARLIGALVAGKTTGIFFVDDLQWADDASLDLLAYLLRHWRGEPILFLATWRAEQIAPEHPARRLLSALQRDERAQIISLARLSADDVKQWVAASTRAALPPDFAAQLARETEGLAFFVNEYLTTLDAQADPAKIDWAIPRGARALIHARLAGNSEVELQLLAAAAVIGRSFDFELARAVSGRGEEETIAALENLIARGILRQDRRADQLDFSHDKFRVLIEEETALARRRLLHRRVAENLLTARGETNARASQIARHFQAAGMDEPAAEYFKRAGDHTRALYANAEAAAHYRTALALGHPDAGELRERIGDLETLAGDYRGALASYESAAASARGAARAEIERKLGNVHQRKGDARAASEHFKTALARVGRNGHADERAKICADWSLAAYQQGEVTAAHDLAARAAKFARAARDPRVRAQSHNILGILARSQNNLAGARTHLEKSRQWADQLNDPSAQAAALNNLALVYRDEGELSKAIALTREALRLSEAQGDRHRAAALRNNLADLLHASGKSNEAMEQLKQAVAQFAEIGGEAGTYLPEIWKLVEW